MRVVSSIVLCLFIMAFVLVAALIQVPQHGSLLRYLVTEAPWISSILALVLFGLPFVLYALTQAKTSEYEELHHTHSTLKHEMGRVLATLTELGKSQQVISAKAAEQATAANVGSELDKLVIGLKTTEGAMAVVDAYLKDPDSLQRIAADVRARQEAVRSRLQTAANVLRPLQAGLVELSTHQAAVQALLGDVQKLGGPDAFDKKGAEVADYIAKAEVQIAGVEQLVPVLKGHNATIAKLRLRIVPLADKKDGILAHWAACGETMTKLGEELKAFTVPKDGESIGDRVARAQGYCTAAEASIATVEKLIAPLSEARQSMDRMRGRGRVLSDETTGILMLLRSIEGLRGNIDKELRALEVDKDGTTLSAKVSKLVGIAESLNGRVAEVEDNLKALVGLRSSLHSVEGKLALNGAQPSSEAARTSR